MESGAENCIRIFQLNCTQTNAPNEAEMNILLKFRNVWINSYDKESYCWTESPQQTLSNSVYAFDYICIYMKITHLFVFLSLGNKLQMSKKQEQNKK